MGSNLHVLVPEATSEPNVARRNEAPGPLLGTMENCCIRHLQWPENGLLHIRVVTHLSRGFDGKA